jgi:hypothetical protein
MKSGNSVVGTPFTTIRHRDNLAVAVQKTPERAEEKSLGKATTIARQHPSLDQKAANAFKPAKPRDVEDRIGVPVRRR